MILFFETETKNIIATGTNGILPKEEIAKLIWLFGNATLISKESFEGTFVGPR